MSMHRLCCCDGETELSTFYVRCEALRFPHAYFEIGNVQDEAGDPKLDFWILVEEGVMIPEAQGNPEHLYIYNLPFISRPLDAWFVTHPEGPKQIEGIFRDNVLGTRPTDFFSHRNLFLATTDIEPDLDSVIARGRNFAVLRRTPESFDPNDPQQVCAARATHQCISSLAIDPGLEDCNCQRESFSRTAAAPGINHAERIKFFAAPRFLDVHNPYSGVTQLSWSAKFNYQSVIQTVELELVPQSQSSSGSVEYSGVFETTSGVVERVLNISVDNTPVLLFGFTRPGLAPTFVDTSSLQDQTRYNGELDVGCKATDPSFTTNHFCGGQQIILREFAVDDAVLPNCQASGFNSPFTTLRWFGDRIEIFECCPPQ